MSEWSTMWRRWRGPLIGLMALAMLSGCRDADLNALDARLDNLRQRPEGSIEALPPSPTYRTAHYTQAQQRSPFNAERRMQAESALSSQDNGPDRQRPRDPLERFPLEQLELVGILTVDGQPSALIRAPDGNVYRLFEGDHLGTDYGRITAINDASIELVERVRDGGDAWRQRRRTLAFNESSQAAE
ncbi:type IV pilus assembly protein PilP [Chromohalobacter marismortui]|uniref:Type IV pilus assembly protein PilP n=1 Tax=Chromohalobacter marismortui TaxID=42055 RepID=A0A4R7NSI8_9GAMM|nr:MULTISPECIES: pilus assembly protein PilP [Chromohalobacter]MCI0509104.1 pilus assembly protein PilP [Chromohalobacter sp.]MCI0592771.1 pilus assembly protein PilP [Chromohalobacter sp.]TDU24004.1 type IV pilus assembly protein PilP [Chromohalobacter marismortui]